MILCEQLLRFDDLEFTNAIIFREKTKTQKFLPAKLSLFMILKFENKDF